MQRLQLVQQLSTSQRQVQEQIMAPQQIQALEILLATIPELDQKINEELAENPTLELLGNGFEELSGNPVEGDNQAENSQQGEAAALAAEKDEALTTLIQLTENWRDYGAASSYGTPSASAEGEERRQFMFDSLTVEPSLHEVLSQQLRETDGLSASTIEICAQIIGSIDETGYLRTHLADLAIITGQDATEVRRALAVIQSFEPPGIGARDLRECLLLQLERQGKKKGLSYRLVDKHLEAAGRNQIPGIAKALHISNAHVYNLLEEIRSLIPHPGHLIGRTDAEFVHPEIYIEKDDKGVWIVRASREFRPRLRISPYYLKMLEDPQISKDDKSYIRGKMTNSRHLLKALDQRHSTIERIGTSLIEFQKPFFEYGIEHMRPLTMSQVADDISVHETTVSRAIANKYVQTPHGLFRLKHFFTAGFQGSGGDEVSSLSIKEKIRHLVEAEDMKKPLSDQKLVTLLTEQGFKVARRTVAKYREEQGIQASHLRRSH